MRASANHTSASYTPLAPRVFGALVLAGSALTGCIGPEQLKMWASPHVPCSADAMDVTVTHNGRYTMEYDVACDAGQVYECVSQAGSTFSGPGTKCEFIGSVEVAPAVDEPPAKQATPTVDLSTHAWSRVRLDKCGASVLMPQDAVAQDIVVEGTPGQFAGTQIHGHEFAFFCFDYSNAPESVPAAELAERMLNGIVESTGAELIRVRPSGGSLDFVMKVPTGYHRGRVQVNNDWGYTALVGPMPGLASKDIGKFVAGVEIGVPASTHP